MIDAGKQFRIPTPRTILRREPSRSHWESHVEKVYATLAPYINACKAKTRQGILLEIMQSDAPFKIVQTTIMHYGMYGCGSQSYTRGFRVFERMIEKENRRLFEVCPVDQPEDPFYWCMIGKTLISPLIEQIGFMRTALAHEALIRFAQPPYHPLTRGAALLGMAYETDLFDAKFVMNALNDPATQTRSIYHGLYAMSSHESRYGSKEYLETMWPYVLHKEFWIAREAVSGLAYNKTARKRFRELLQREDFDERLRKQIEEQLSWSC